MPCSCTHRTVLKYAFRGYYGRIMCNGCTLHDFNISSDAFLNCKSFRPFAPLTVWKTLRPQSIFGLLGYLNMQIWVEWSYCLILNQCIIVGNCPNECKIARIWKSEEKRFQFRYQNSKTLHYGAGAYPEWRYQSESTSFSLFFLPVWATLMEVSCFVSLIELFLTFWPHFGFDFLFLGDFWAVLNNAHPCNARSKVEYS